MEMRYARVRVVKGMMDRGLTRGELATLFRCTSAFQLHKDEGSLRVGELV